MGDWVDDAQAAADLHLAAALASRDRGQIGPGSDDCAECGEPIPAERRAAMPAATCCTFCQEERERRRR
jgi:phage/conjugal plasmid C-4 type zinc finger TraR family protein